MRHECIVIAETRQSSGINSLKRKSRRLMGESLVRRLFRELIANTPMPLAAQVWYLPARHHV
jgi:hypothetical protein